MTKEELKQEAREKYFNHKMMEFQGFYNRHYYYLGYLDSAEPREKRIAEPLLVGQAVVFLTMECKLRLGYTNKYMTAYIPKIEVVDGKNTDLHIDKPVYAIHLADVREL